MKVFTIGFNKTGTTSIHAFFMYHGMKSQHDKHWDFDNYQCFSDGKHHNGLFKSYEQKYPDARFILNTRPLRNWLKSRSKHCYTLNRGWGGWPPNRGKYSEWIERREEHFNDVMNHFAATPNKLAVINIERKGWEELLLSTLWDEPPEVKIRAFNNKIPDDTIPDDVLSEISREIAAVLKEKGMDGGQLVPQNPNLPLFRSHL